MSKYFTNIPLEPENLASLKEAIINQVVADEDFRKVVNIKKVKNGEPLAVIGEMDAVGHAGAGCNPEYKQIGINNSLKRWALKAWEIALELCYNDLEDTIAEYSLKEGTAIADLTGTDFMAIYTELLTTQVKRMMWRLIWFGDTAAKNISNGGVITNGKDVTLFTPTDGLFKKLFAIGAAHANQVTAIAANAKTTYAAQTSDMRAAGVATGLLDTIILDANPMINANGQGVFICNQKFVDVLRFDVKQTTKYQMDAATIGDGITINHYDGKVIIGVAAWDYLINEYENTGTKWNKPYRVVYANPRNLVVGADAADPISELDVFFDKKARTNNIYATGKLDTNVAQDELVHLAY